MPIKKLSFEFFNSFDLVHAVSLEFHHLGLQSYFVPEGLLPVEMIVFLQLSQMLLKRSQVGPYSI